MPRRPFRLALLIAVAAALVVLVVTLGPLLRRPASPLPIEGGIEAWSAGPTSPVALTEVAVAVHDGRIWVVGGLAADGRAVDTVQVFDPVAGSWSVDPLPLPEPLHHAALVSDAGLLHVLGGYRADGSASDAVYVRAGEVWGEGLPLPAARGAGAAAWDGTRIVYGGGVGPDGVADTVWAMAPPNGPWEPLGVLSEAREHLAAASDGAGRVVFVGGRRGSLTTNLGTADLVVGGTVRRLGELPTPRGGVAAFWSASHGACLVGGESPGGTHAEVECVATDGSVVRLPDLARARHGLGAAVVDGRAYVLLGGERPGLFVSDAVESLRLP